MIIFIFSILIIVNSYPVKDLIAWEDSIQNNHKRISAPKLKYEIVKNFNNSNLDYVIVQSDVDCPLGRKTDSELAEHGLKEIENPEIFALAIQKGYKKVSVEVSYIKGLYYDNLYINKINSSNLEFACHTSNKLGLKTTQIEIK